MLILIAGPYRSGTGNDPTLIQQNLERLEAVALPLYLKGHIPVIGEWIALPIMKLAGSKEVGDEVFTKMQYPISHGILRRCDAIFRIEGDSNGADQDVKLGKQLGLKIYHSLEEVPDAGNEN